MNNEKDKIVTKPKKKMTPIKMRITIQETVEAITTTMGTKKRIEDEDKSDGSRWTLFHFHALPLYILF